MNEESKELGVQAHDKVGVGEIFGQMAKKMAGIGGTLHITDETMLNAVPSIAWDLAEKTKKPVIIVVRRG